jgi:hypothetical protein
MVEILESILNGKVETNTVVLLCGWLGQTGVKCTEQTFAPGESEDHAP